MKKKVWEQEGFRSEEFFMAAERIGRTSEDALRWMVTFTQTNLDDFNDAQWLNTQTEYGAVLDAVSDKVEASFSRFKWEEKVGQATRPSRKQVREGQEVAQNNLANYLSGHLRGELPLALHRALDWNSASISFDTDKAAVLVTGRMMFWILQHAAKIRICTECEGQRIRGLMRAYGSLPAGVFVAARKDQHYCSVRCQNRVKQRKWQENQAEKARLKVTPRTKKKRNP